MRITGLLGRTLRAVPAGVSPALGLAARAGFLRRSEDGWLLLPLGVRVVARMAEALTTGITCETVQIRLGPEADRGRAYAGLLQGEIQSHRQLPLRIASTGCEGGTQVSATAANRTRIEMDLVGTFAEVDSLTAFMHQADERLVRVGEASGIRLMPVRDVAGARAWLAPGESGRNVVLNCAACGSAHVRGAAPFARQELAPSPPRARERVHTPGASTIQSLAETLGVGTERTLKALFLSTERGTLIFAVVRGDLDVSLEKLGAVVDAKVLGPASEAQIIASGAVPGFASPIGMSVMESDRPDGIRVIADPSVFSGTDFAAGANEPDYHFVHVDPRRDFVITREADIALPPSDACCATCGSRLTEQRGTILARWTPLPAPAFAGEGGAKEFGAAAWSAIDLLVTLEQVVAACADEQGIAWPALLAPADVHVVDLKAAEPAAQVARALDARGLRVLLDDRPLAAGVKFTDADLIGCPLRVTISPRSLQAGGGELSGRRGLKQTVIPLSGIPDTAHAQLDALMST